MEESFIGGDFMFSAVPIFIFIVFAIIIGIIIFAVIGSIHSWSKNNQQPRLSTPATVVTKRSKVSGGGETNAHSSYYVTFEFPSGDRTEFKVKGEQFGILVEGDNGELQFQGTRYLDFTRKNHVGDSAQ
ncbi:DUF2500 domain-containing protein [Niallia sp. JL1B1071]|uniref:DUF2500 domain-containing protein n=1 Tax=Niallia tiangongensis TaxID=3237105 RepID=UPI0037DCF5A2